MTRVADVSGSTSGVSALVAVLALAGCAGEPAPAPTVASDPMEVRAGSALDELKDSLAREGGGTVDVSRYSYGDGAAVAPEQVRTLSVHATGEVSLVSFDGGPSIIENGDGAVELDRDAGCWRRSSSERVRMLSGTDETGRLPAVVLDLLDDARGRRAEPATDDPGWTTVTASVPESALLALVEPAVRQDPEWSTATDATPVRISFPEEGPQAAMVVEVFLPPLVESGEELGIEALSGARGQAAADDQTTLSFAVVQGSTGEGPATPDRLCGLDG